MLVEHGLCELVACVTGILYDETPIKLRAQVGDAGNERTRSIVKILQSEYHIAVALRATAKAERGDLDENIFLVIPLPCHVQDLDRTTRENSWRAVADMMELPRLAQFGRSC